VAFASGRQALARAEENAQGRAFVFRQLVLVLLERSLACAVAHAAHAHSAKHCRIV
jgi:hypothetical protein